MFMYFDDYKVHFIFTYRSIVTNNNSIKVWPKYVRYKMIFLFVHLLLRIKDVRWEEISTPGRTMVDFNGHSY